MTTDDVPPRPLPGGIGYVYAKVADDLAARIAAGEFRPGSLLPGRGRIAAEYGVAEMTARRAVEELEARGLVQRDAARGALILHKHST